MNKDSCRKMFTQFKLGIEQIDNEHEQLFYICGKISDLVLNREIEKESISKVIGQLESYAEQHFQHEELFFSENGLEIEKHRAKHSEFVEKISQFSGKIKTLNDRDKIQISQVLSHIILFVYSWLTTHIIIDDKMLVNAILEKDKPALDIEDLSDLMWSIDEHVKTLNNLIVFGLYKDQINQDIQDFREDSLFENIETFKSNVVEEIYNMMAGYSEKIEEIHVKLSAMPIKSDLSILISSEMGVLWREDIDPRLDSYKSEISRFINDFKIHESDREKKLLFGLLKKGWWLFTILLGGAATFIWWIVSNIDKILHALESINQLNK